MPFEVLVYGVSGVILVFKPGYSNQGKILCYYNVSFYALISHVGRVSCEIVFQQFIYSLT